MDSLSRLVRTRVCLSWRLLSFPEKRPCNSLWPHRSCWVHFVARNNHACPLSDESAWTEQGEFSLEIMVTQITVPVLMRVSWVQCLSACLPVLLSLVVDISVSFFVCVRPSICVGAGSSWWLECKVWCALRHSSFDLWMFGQRTPARETWEGKLGKG